MERLSTRTSELAALEAGRVSSKAPPGRAFTRYAQTLIRSKGDSYLLREMAKQWKDAEIERVIKAAAMAGTDFREWEKRKAADDSRRQQIVATETAAAHAMGITEPAQVDLYLKSAIAAGTTTDSTWASALSTYDRMAGEFIEALRPATIIGKIEGLARVPFNVRLARATAGTSASWVGQDDPARVSRMSMDHLNLARTRIEVMTVITQELAEDSSPDATARIQGDMVREIARFSDAQFIDPTVAANGSVSPASITHGVTPRHSTGSSVAQISADVEAAIAAGLAAGVTYETGVWVMHPRTATYLSHVLTAGNARMWPEIGGLRGGTWYGLPVITSASVPIDTGNDTYIVLLDAQHVAVASGTIILDASRQGSLQMDSAPSDSATSMISLWQKNLVGLRAQLFINWQRRHDAAVAVIDDVSF